MNSEERRLILIIENGINPYNLGQDISGNSAHVIEINGGEEGLSIARQLKPDLVICDIYNSPVGGISICTELKSDAATSHASVILLGPVSQQIDGLLAGADDYISFPFDKYVLGLKIENLIRLRNAMRGKAVQEMSAQSESSRLNNQFLEKLEQLILENLADPDFGVHEMAFQIGISVSVLYRKLRFHTGVTVNEFVKTIRMKRAMKLLETGIYPVNEVAAAIGYEDSKYFSKEFRKSFGKTPTEVKRRDK